MKKGWILALTAVFLFAGTVIWSAFKSVARPPRFVPEPTVIWNDPTSKEARRLYFEAEAPYKVNVEAPVQVELVPDFNGVELIGDTSLMQYLGVQTVQMNGSTEIGIYIKNETTDEVAKELAQPDSPTHASFRAAHIIARIGLGTDQNRQWKQREFRFNNCINVTANTPLKASYLHLSFNAIDSSKVHVQAENLTVQFPAFAFKNPYYTQLEGQCERIVVNQFTAGTLDATALDARDFYMYQPKEANIHMRASRLVRMIGVENCQVAVEGEPPYRWIEQK
ncbi:MAG: hypothetical protein JNM22_21000 [Saprospiraceae bacterium]|nr:hypothetical protein [Saprospiraceae bacterium]